MDLSLEIIPVEQITVGDEGHTIFTFQKRKIPKTFFGIGLWTRRASQSDPFQGGQ